MIVPDLLYRDEINQEYLGLSTQIAECYRDKELIWRQSPDIIEKDYLLGEELAFRLQGMSPDDWESAKEERSLFGSIAVFFFDIAAFPMLSAKTVTGWISASLSSRIPLFHPCVYDRRVAEHNYFLEQIRESVNEGILVGEPNLLQAQDTPKVKITREEFFRYLMTAADNLDFMTPIIFAAYYKRPFWGVPSFSEKPSADLEKQKQLSGIAKAVAEVGDVKPQDVTVYVTTEQSIGIQIKGRRGSKPFFFTADVLGFADGRFSSKIHVSWILFLWFVGNRNGTFTEIHAKDLGIVNCKRQLTILRNRFRQLLGLPAYFAKIGH